MMRHQRDRNRAVVLAMRCRLLLSDLVDALRQFSHGFLHSPPGC